MAKKYIDADKLLAEVERLYKQNEGDFDNGCYNEDQRCGYDIALLDLRMILDSLQQKQPEVLKSWLEKQFKTAQRCMQQAERDWNRAYENGAMEAYGNTLSFIGRTIPNQENDKEQSEVDLEKFTEKMSDWKARFNHPDDISIKATMVFTARMFYMYPDIAREWYASLPKVTQD